MTYRRQYPNLPPDEFLTPRLLELATEARGIAARRSDAVTERRQLATEAAEEAARDADRKVAATAIRAGKSMTEVGTPAMDELVKARELLDMEIGASDSALQGVENDMTAEFAAMQDSDKTSGRAVLRAAEAKYRKAVDTLPELRAAYLQARAVHDYLRGASNLPGCGSAVWPPKDNGLPLNTLNASGERVHMLAPVTAEFLIAHTFATDLDERTDG